MEVFLSKQNIYPKTEAKQASSSNQKIKTKFYEPQNTYQNDKKNQKRDEA